MGDVYVGALHSHGGLVVVQLTQQRGDTSLPCAFLPVVRFHPSRASQGVELHKAKQRLVGMVQLAFQQPVEMETLGGPHAAEQKQTNGLNGESSVA